MSVINFDTETHLIEPGLLAPPLVCVQWKTDEDDYASMCHREQAEHRITTWIHGHDLIVGHNVSYDLAVIAAQWPHLLPFIFEKLDRDEITCTQIRDQLIMISRGEFRAAMVGDEFVKVQYSLSDCMHRHFGRHLQKDGWRLFYRAFDEVPDIAAWPQRALDFQTAWRNGRIPDWAQEAIEREDIEDKDVQAMLASDLDEPVRYALEDVNADLALYESQEAQFTPVLKDQFRQTRAHFALHLASCWGLYTDLDAVDALAKDLDAEFEALKFELQQEGIIRANGTADTAKAKAVMVAACEEEDLTVIATKGGDVSMSAEACERFDEDSVIGRYSQFLTVRRTRSSDIKMLRMGCEYPIQPRYDMADTGRTRAAKPNIQAINRGAGIREAFRPRPGTVFIQADFEGLELHTLAVWCLEKIGWSALADALNAKMDVHTAMAVEMLGISYEEAMVRKKAGDKEIKEFRQRAKALNFGLPGGLGVKKFVRYAKNNYNVVLTEAEAAQYKSAWLRRFPEMNEFFRLAGATTNNPSKLGDEEHLFTGRMRGNVRYSALCNGRFQGLGADAAKEAMYRVSKACYVETESPLYGSRPVAFVHDEILAESAREKAPEAAKELGKVMEAGANFYLHRVPVRCKPLLMARWSKSAEPIYDPNGRLLVWGE